MAHLEFSEVPDQPLKESVWCSEWVPGKALMKNANLTHRPFPKYPRMNISPWQPSSCTPNRGSPSKPLLRHALRYEERVFDPAPLTSEARVP